MTNTVFLLVGVGSMFLGGALSIVLLQHRKLKVGSIVIEDGYDGHEALKQTCFALLRIAVKRMTMLKKLGYAYILHILVRIMRLSDKFTSYLYARSRNMFVKSALKNKGTVPHFWEQLKTYKQEIDKEKEDSEKS